MTAWGHFRVREKKTPCSRQKRGMSTLTPLTELSARELMEQLRANPGKTRLIREVERRIAPFLKAGVATFEDPEPAYYEALYETTRLSAVEYFLNEYSGGLEQFAYGRVRRWSVQQAGLVTPKLRRDGASRENSTSLNAAQEAHGFDIAARPVMTDGERAWNTQVIREAFTELASEVNPATGAPYLDGKLIKTVLTIGNLHRDDALPEMNTYEAAAKTLRVTERTLYNRVNAAKDAVASYPVLAFTILELCGDDGRFEPAVATPVMAVVA